MHLKVVINTFADRFPETLGMVVSTIGFILGLTEMPSFNETMQNVALVCSATLSVVTIGYMLLKSYKTYKELKYLNRNGKQ